MTKLIDLTGQKFGRLTVVARAANSSTREAKWLCKCECGNFKVISSTHLRDGTTQSCGCLSKEMRAVRGRRSKIWERTRTHGDFGTRLYGVWAGMKRRCQNPNTKYYADYGGRGIKVCDEWQKYEPFKKWALSMGYHDGLTIERKEVNGDYCPANCEWIPLEEQNKNKRNTIRLEYQGKLYTIKEIAEMTGLKERTIAGRYERGWSIEKIISTKLKKNQYE